MSNDPLDTPIVDELRSIVSDTGLQYTERMFKTMSSIPTVLPGEEAIMAMDVACGRVTALEAVEAYSRWEHFRSSLSRMLIKLHELEVAARQAEAKGNSPSK